MKQIQVFAAQLQVQRGERRPGWEVRTCSSIEISNFNLDQYLRFMSECWRRLNKSRSSLDESWRMDMEQVDNCPSRLGV